MENNLEVWKLKNRNESAKKKTKDENEESKVIETKDTGGRVEMSAAPKEAAINTVEVPEAKAGMENGEDVALAILSPLMKK